MSEDVEPISIRDAAERLGLPEPRLRVWMSRHRARKVGKIGKIAYYDYWDLSTIDALKNLGMKIPETYQERARWREESRPASRSVAA